MLYCIKNAGTKIAIHLFFMLFTPKPRYKPSSAKVVDMGNRTRLRSAKISGIGAINIGARYGNTP